MDLLGSLHIDGDEILNSCRTQAYARAAGVPWNLPSNPCQGVCCQHFDEGYGTAPDVGPNIAPWVDPLNPATTKFLGTHGRLTLNTVEADTPAGPVLRKRLTWMGWVIGSCAEGVQAGLAWLPTQLNPWCRSCQETNGVVWANCGRTAPFNATPQPAPRPDPLIGLQCGDPAPVLEPHPEVAPWLDTGRRELLRMNYMDGSFRVVQEENLTVPDCFGVMVTFAFDVGTSSMWTASEPACEIDLGSIGGRPCRSLTLAPGESVGECERCTPVPCSCQTNSERWLDGPAADETGDGGFGPLASTLATAPSNPDDTLAACSWSAPLSYRRATCITPVFPWSEADFRIEVGNPTAASVQNMRLTVWEAFTGLPDPGSCDGHEVYDLIQPIMELGVRLGPESTLTLDGRTGRAEVKCPGRQPRLAVDEVCGDLSFPILRCSKRLWVAIDVDCYQPDPGPVWLGTTIAGRIPITIS